MIALHISIVISDCNDSVFSSDLSEFPRYFLHRFPDVASRVAVSGKCEILIWVKFWRPRENFSESHYLYHRIMAVSADSEIRAGAPQWLDSDLEPQPRED